MSIEFGPEWLHPPVFRRAVRDTTGTRYLSVLARSTPRCRRRIGACEGRLE